MSGQKNEHGGSHGDGEHKKHKKHHPHAHPEHEHEEGWIVSFADNVLLMMGFFVILLAMNMGPKGTSDGAPSDQPSDELLDMAIAIREAFNNPLDISSTDPADQVLIRRMRERMTKGDVRDSSPDGQSHNSQTVRPSEWSGEGGFVLFAEASSAINEEARLTIKQLAGRVVGLHWIVEVRGYASSLETGGDVKKGRDLAYARAWAIGMELTRAGLKWNQVRLVSCGDATPAIQRTRSNAENVTNQRGEILVTAEIMPPDPYNRAPDSVGGQGAATQGPEGRDPGGH